MKISDSAIWESPILRWAGSKRKLIPLLIKFSPGQYNRYVEPFCGSASLFFALRPNMAILGDTNEELIHFYHILRFHPRILARSSFSIPIKAKTYYKVRAMSPDILSPIEKAARFFYLNRFCFPRGVKTGRLPNEKHFYRCSIALRKAKILNSDFERTLSMVKARDFVYLDPPYATKDRRYRGEYGNNCFQYKDVERLLKSIDSISKIGAFFLLSYSYSEDLVNSISKRWNFRIIDVRRHVSGFAKDREVVKELIVSNISFGG